MTKFKTLPDLETLVDFVVSKYKPEKIRLVSSKGVIVYEKE